VKLPISAVTLVVIMAAPMVAAEPVTKAAPTGSTADAAADIGNVRTYGAKGDGNADDTAAIQAACAAGRSVLLPPGTYVVSRPIFIAGRLQIQGPGATIVSSEPSGALFTASGDLTGLVIRDVVLRTSRKDLTTRGQALFKVDYHSVDGALFDNVTFDTGSSYSNGVALAAQIGTTVKSVTVRNCTFTGASAGIEFVHHVDASQRVVDVKITGNRFIHNGLKDDQYAGFGISLSGPLSSVEVSGNYIRGYPYAGIELVATKFGSFEADYLIQGNTVVSTGRGIMTDVGPGGSPIRMSHVSIIGNIVKDNRFFQHFQGLSDSVVEGNVVETRHTMPSADHQIDFFAFYDSERLVVASNIFRLDLVSAEAGKALVGMYGVSDSHISGNRFGSTGFHVLKVGSAKMPSADNSFAGNRFVHEDNGGPGAPIAFGGAGTTRNRLDGSTIVSRHESTYSSEAAGNVATGTVTVRSDTGTITAIARREFGGITRDLDLTKQVDLPPHLVLRGAPAAGFTVTLPEHEAVYTISNGSGQTATIKAPHGGTVTIAASAVKTVFVTGGKASGL
jgi:pectate lyase-like protein